MSMTLESYIKKFLEKSIEAVKSEELKDFYSLFLEEAKKYDDKTASSDLEKILSLESFDGVPVNVDDSMGFKFLDIQSKVKQILDKLSIILFLTPEPINQTFKYVFSTIVQMDKVLNEIDKRYKESKMTDKDHEYLKIIESYVDYFYNVFVLPLDTRIKRLIEELRSK